MRSPRRRAGPGWETRAARPVAAIPVNSPVWVPAKSASIAALPGSARHPRRRFYAWRMTLASGIPIDELDPGIRPQDDLFRHVNGRWLARTEIPADRARDSTFRILADQAENALREIVEEAASAPEGSEERKFGDVHVSFMDADRA